MYSPLPPECVLKNSEIHGLGLFIIKDIPKGHDFGIGHIEDPEFQDGYIRTPLGAFFNHSKAPNCEIIKDGRFLRLISIRKIKAGEELTAFYTLYQP